MNTGREEEEEEEEKGSTSSSAVGSAGSEQKNCHKCPHRTRQTHRETHTKTTFRFWFHKFIIIGWFGLFPLGGFETLDLKPRRLTRM